jgi:phosphomannomutase
VSHLVADLPRYAMLKTKFTVPKEKLPAALAAMRAKWPDVTENTLDGLRLDGSDWWLHARASNTEPVVRIIAEAPTEEQAKELCREAGELLTRT